MQHALNPAPSPAARSFGLAVFEDKLFAVGGFRDDGESSTVLASVETLACATTCSWSEDNSLKVARYSFVGATSAP